MKWIVLTCAMLSLIQYLRADVRLHFFSPTQNVKAENIVTDLDALQKVCQSTLSFIRKHEHKDWFVPVKEGFLNKKDITLDDVKKTLSFIIWVIHNDKGKLKQRMLDPEFLQKHFTFMFWKPDADTAAKRKVDIGNDQIRLTKYLIFQVDGSYKKTSDFSCALYEVQECNKDLLLKYTKQDVINGALDGKKGAKPLVWLSRDSLEEAIMQGTIYITMPDKKVRVFNVAFNNGIAYDQKLKDKKAQKRYWSFKEVGGILGWGPDAQHKIKIMPGVTFAGDVYSLGLGKIIALQYPDQQTGKSSLRIGVLADTGGAFEDNLYQLDFFTGVFPSREAFNKETTHIPTVAQAYLMIKKP